MCHEFLLVLETSCEGVARRLAGRTNVLRFAGARELMKALGTHCLVLFIAFPWHCLACLYCIVNEFLQTKRRRMKFVDVVSVAWLKQHHKVCTNRQK